jgi:hypothetical protein
MPSLIHFLLYHECTSDNSILPQRKNHIDPLWKFSENSFKGPKIYEWKCQNGEQFSGPRNYFEFHFSLRLPIPFSIPCWYHASSKRLLQNSRPTLDNGEITCICKTGPDTSVKWGRLSAGLMTTTRRYIYGIYPTNVFPLFDGFACVCRCILFKNYRGSVILLDAYWILD